MNKVALITGGTSGIGKATSIEFLRKKYKVICLGRSNKNIEQFKSEVGTQENLIIMKGDLTDSNFLSKIILNLSQSYTSIDCLINCAGIIGHGGITKESLETWDKVLEINLTSIFKLIKNLLERNLIISGGSIVNVSSICSKKVCGSISYSVSKAGLDMLTKALSIELAPRRIRVNSINPGLIRTNLHSSAGLFKNDQQYEQWFNSSIINKHPIQREGSTQEVANLISFLVSEQSSWITGTNISIDGGRATL